MIPAFEQSLADAVKRRADVAVALQSAALLQWSWLRDYVVRGLAEVAAECDAQVAKARTALDEQRWAIVPNKQRASRLAAKQRWTCTVAALAPLLPLPN